MSRNLDLVPDSRLPTEFYGSTTVHKILEIDHSGTRFYRSEQWVFERQLGKGGFGEVQLQKCISGAKKSTVRAVKAIAKPENARSSVDFNRELEAMAKFSHDRYKHWFVQSFGWYEDSTTVFITMEHCPYGDLFQYLSDRSVLSTTETQSVIFQVLEGLDHMHSNDFAHRDLKPGNILIKSKPPEGKWWVVLADFGISKRASENTATTEVKGTEGYMAPELHDLRNLAKPNLAKPPSISDFQATDMWALGEVVFRLLTGEAVFGSPWELLEYRQGKQPFPSGRVPSDAGDDGDEFIRNLMQIDPKERRTASQCLLHPWMESQRTKLEEDMSQLNLEQAAPQASVSPVTEKYSASLSSSVGIGPSRWKDVEQSAAQDLVPPDTPTRSLESAAGQKTRQRPPKPGSEKVISVHFRGVGRRVGGDRPRKPRGTPTVITTAPTTLESLWGRVTVLQFSPDGNVLAAGVADNPLAVAGGARKCPILLWQAPWTTEPVVLKGHDRVVNSFAFLPPDGKKLVSASSDGTILLWDSSSGTLLQSFAGHSREVVAVAVASPDGKMIRSASFDKTIRVWKIGQEQAVQTVNVPIVGLPEQTLLSSDGTFLASPISQSQQSMWCLRDVKSGKVLRECAPGTTFMLRGAFSPDSKRLALVALNRTVRIWDVETGAELMALDGHGMRVMAVAFSADNRTVATATPQDIRIWDGQSGEELKLISVKTWTLAFSPDGKSVVSGDGKDLRIWNLE